MPIEVFGCFCVIIGLINKKKSVVILIRLNLRIKWIKLKFNNIIINNNINTIILMNSNMFLVYLIKK